MKRPIFKNLLTQNLCKPLDQQVRIEHVLDATNDLILRDGQPVNTIRTNGSNSYIDLGYTLEPNSNYTMCGWLKTGDGSNNAMLGAWNSQGAMIWLNGGQMLAPHGPSGHLDTNITVTGNGWRHLCISYDGTNQRAYIDGVLVITRSEAPFGAPPNNIWLGRYASNYGSNVVYDARIYNRALTGTEIVKVCRFEDPAPSNLLSRHLLDEVSGTIVKDISGNDRHGTIINTVTFSQDS